MNARRIPSRALPHRSLVGIAPLRGSNASGRVYDAEVIIERALIVDGANTVGGQYEREAGVVGVIYCDRDAFPDKLPMPDSKVRLWVGERDEHEAVVRRIERHHDRRIGDILTVVLA